jgi:hypothetical protein
MSRYMMRSQFNNGLVTRDVASGASVRKDVEVQLLSAARAIRGAVSPTYGARVRDAELVRQLEAESTRRPGLSCWAA